MLKAQRIAHTWAQRLRRLGADSGERTGAGSCQAVAARVGFCPAAGWDQSGDMIKSLFQKTPLWLDSGEAIGLGQEEQLGDPLGGTARVWREPRVAWTEERAVEERAGPI